jgi:queuine tRNA-ribosyltransferase
MGESSMFEICFPTLTEVDMDFKLQNTDDRSGARTGEITTAHGKIKTPIFMPVGTLGSVKGVHQHELKEDINAEIILGNTYHLYLRPGLEVLEQAGGLHKFNGWDRPMLTDSGGFQVFSLAENRKLTEEGAIFRSHIDGSKHMFTPENVMDTQRIIGADIIMAFDECPPGTSSYGLAVGEPVEDMYDMIEVVNQVLPENKPRYLMGVGTPINILEAISRGVDMFDCVMPTRNARNGMIFTSEGTLNMRNLKWANDFSPLDPNGTSYVDTFYSKAYVRHLIRSNELLAGQICSIHNLAFYLWLVREAREQINQGTFSDWKKVMVQKLGRRL